MVFILRPSHLLSFVLVGWINRNQQDVIEYLLTENRVLREKLGSEKLEEEYSPGHASVECSATTIAKLPEVRSLTETALY